MDRTRGTGTGWTVEPLELDRVSEVAEIYRESFPESTLGRLGPKVLQRFISSFVRYRAGCGVVCVQKDERSRGDVLGYVLGTEDQRSYYRAFVARQWPVFGPSMLRLLIRDRSFARGGALRVRRVVRIAGARGPSSGRRKEAVAMPRASLMSIGVRSRARNHGVASALVRAFMMEMTERGAESIKLGVRADNVPARRVYEGLGWRAAVSETSPDGVAGWLYIWDRVGCDSGA